MERINQIQETSAVIEHNLLVVAFKGEEKKQGLGKQLADWMWFRVSTRRRELGFREEEEEEEEEGEGEGEDWGLMDRRKQLKVENEPEEEAEEGSRFT